MSKQDGIQVSTVQPPITGDTNAWRDYWQKRGQLWRTEPEIDVERQKYLAERRSITPDIEQGIYSFKGIKLTRADIEWLLATHENGRGSVDWSDESQRGRQGVDLRGADLRRINLCGLPLARLCAGLSWYKRNFHMSEQLDDAGVCLERADLRETHLEGAILRGAHLEHSDLRGAFLEEADLSRAHLQGANFREAHLEKTKFIRTHLQWADLPEAHLEGAKLIRAHLEGAHLRRAHLEGADLRRAFFDIATNLDGTFITNMKGESVLLAGIHWGGVDLTMLNWGQVKTLGDECVARQNKWSNQDWKDKATRLTEYEEAVRANRQLAVALQAQGLNEDAARFSYRAQMLQRTVYRLQGGAGSFLQYLFSLFLDLLAGYGYKPWRSFVAYLVVITLFATAYFLIGHTVGPALSPLGAWVFSMTSFHGRGFFPGGIKLDAPLTVLAALEAFVGLLIEVTFIATLTRRLFGQ
jgi:uncharacterized protein YjbI with pentapeptide repeats